MVRTTRVRDIHEASRIATSQDRPVQILPSDGPVSKGDLGYIDLWDLDGTVKEFDLIAVHEEHDTCYRTRLRYIRPGRFYARSYGEGFEVVLEFEARGAERCKEICGCTAHNERGN
jgi:hypothetical protein